MIARTSGLVAWREANDEAIKAATQNVPGAVTYWHTVRDAIAAINGAAPEVGE